MKLRMLCLAVLLLLPVARAVAEEGPPAGEEGESSGLLATGRVVGQTLSVAIAGAIFASSGGAMAGQMLANSVPSASLSSAEIGTLQYLFLRSFHAALARRDWLPSIVWDGAR